jgi:hypothetical protein
MRRLVLAAAVLLAVPGAARAYVVAGHPWPNHRISYYNAVKADDWAVRRAVADWNASGADVRFVPAPAGRAEVTIKLGGVPTGSCGWANYGDQRGAHVDLAGSGLCASGAILVEVVAHELGHVLGLGHELHKCAVMNAIGGILGLCHHLPSQPLWKYLCDPLQPDDIAGAVALYGGQPRPVTQPACDAWGPIGAPAGLAAAGDPAVSPDVHLSWRDAAAPKALIPGLAALQLDPQVVIALAQGSCPTDPLHDGFLMEVPAKPGQTQDVVVTSFAALQPGSYCFAAWTQDALQRHSALATAQLTVGP